MNRLSFKFSRSRLVALDFDNRRLRVVSFEPRPGRPNVKVMAAVSMPEGLDLSSAEEMGGFIGRSLGKLRLHNARVLMSVPRGQAVLKPLTLPAGVPTTDMPGMVQFQIAKELPFPAEEAVVDFLFEGGHVGSAPADGPTDNGQEVLAAAIRLPVADFYRKTAEAAGVRLMGLGLRPLAALRCVFRCRPIQPQQCLMLVDLSSEDAEIDIFVGETLAFSRSVTLKTPSADAGEVERRLAAQAVVMEVVRSIQSFHTMHRGEGVHRVLVAGDSNLEAEVVDALARRTQLSCELLDPSGPLGLKGGAQTSAFAAALGMAIAHGDKSESIDFLNPRRPMVRRDRRKTVAAAAALAAIVLVLAGSVSGWMMLESKDSELAAVSRRLQQEKDQNKIVEQLARRARAIDDWDRASVAWLDHWAYLSTAFPSAADVYIKDFKHAGSGGAIAFRVQARNGQVITDLAERLASLPPYKFNPGKLVTSNDPYGYNVETDMTVLIDPESDVDWSELTPVARPADDGSAELISQMRPGQRIEQPARPTPTPVVPAPSPPPNAPPPAAEPPSQAPAPPARGGPDSSGQRPVRPEDFRGRQRR